MNKALLGLLIAAPLFADRDMDEHNKWMSESAITLHELTNAGDRGIPDHLLRRAHCVGVIPNLKRAGFIVGAKYGKGVLTCRTADGNWSAPAIMRIEGGSIGLQIGAGETDVVLLVMNESGENKLTRDKFTIGGDATVMAGPLGRSAEAETDATMAAEILAYSRSRGIFGGVSLEGATLRPDNDDDAKIYGHPVTVHEILHGRVTPPSAASALYSELSRFPHVEH
jgi:lipid-binding SYLF domain-containing protein